MTCAKLWPDINIIFHVRAIHIFTRLGLWAYDVFVKWVAGTWRWKSMRALSHDDFIKWKHFSRYWPFVRGIHRSPVNSPHKGQWRRALMFSLICAGINGCVNNDEAGDLRRHRAHFDVAVMLIFGYPYRKPVRWCCTVFVGLMISLPA